MIEPMSTIVLAAVIFLALCGTAFAILLSAGSANSRAEEEYWAAYWLDTPSTDTSSDVIIARIPHAISNHDEDARKAA